MNSPSPPHIGVFGKLPSAGDFVAHNAGQPVARSLQDWLQGEMDALCARSIALPDATVRFLYRDPEGRGACIGALRRSHDGVGRPFPLCIFAYVDIELATHRFPSMPSAYGPFIDGTVALLHTCERHSPEQVFEAAMALPMPQQVEFEEAHQWAHQALEHTAGKNLLEALFGPLDQDVRFHGFNMFLSACKQVEANVPGVAAIILECPASDDVQLTFWLRLCHERLQWRQAPPGVFWRGTDSPDSRLLITLGAPSVGVLGFIADPTAEAERLWPMRTTNERSMTTGRQALTPAQLRVLDTPGATAAAILDALR